MKSLHPEGYHFWNCHCGALNGILVTPKSSSVIFYLCWRLMIPGLHKAFLAFKSEADAHFPPEVSGWVHTDWVEALSEIASHHLNWKKSEVRHAGLTCKVGKGWCGKQIRRAQSSAVKMELSPFFGCLLSTPTYTFLYIPRCELSYSMALPNWLVDYSEWLGLKQWVHVWETPEWRFFLKFVIN